MARPLYRATEPTFVDGRRRKAGEQFRTDAKPSRSWERLDGEIPEAEPQELRGNRTEFPAAQVGAPPHEGDEELERLRAEYELVFDKKPHHAKKADTLRQDIDEEKARKSE